MRYCAAKEPAWARVVPRAEKNIEGEELKEVSCVDQVEVSVETRGWSLASFDLGSRRDTIGVC